MEKNMNLMKIEKINFISDAKDMTLKGSVLCGSLNYPTEIKVSISEINKLINKIQRQHPETDVNELLVTEIMPDGEIYYEMDFSKINACIEYGELQQSYSFVQIRA